MSPKRGTSSVVFAMHVPDFLSPSPLGGYVSWKKTLYKPSPALNSTGLFSAKRLLTLSQKILTKKIRKTHVNTKVLERPADN